MTLTPEQQAKAFELLKEAGSSVNPMDPDHWTSWVKDVRNFLKPFITDEDDHDPEPRNTGDAFKPEYPGERQFD